MVVLLQFAIKTFDLVRALTGGGPGISTTFPAIYVYDFMFQRGQIGRGAAAAVMMLLALLSCSCPTRYRRSGGRARRCARWLAALRSPVALADLRCAGGVGGVLSAAPLVVVVLNSLRDAGDRRSGLIALPHSLALRQLRPGLEQLLRRPPATASGSTSATRCVMTIPATIISTRSARSTAMSSRNGGSAATASCSRMVILGVFMPGQMALLPWAFMLGDLGLTNTIDGADPHPCRPGPVLHDAVLPQLLRQHPARPDQGGAHRRRRLLAHLLADHPAALAADPDRHGDLAVHRHLERVPLRRHLHLRRAAADHRGAGRAQRHRPTDVPQYDVRAPRC